MFLYFRVSEELGPHINYVYVTDEVPLWSKDGLLRKAFIATRKYRRSFVSAALQPAIIISHLLGYTSWFRLLIFNEHAEVVVPNMHVPKKLFEDYFFAESAGPDEGDLI
ncbi:hypothetical protein LOCC1_G004462 [Lachnellula occidentalis]|uniref:Uncharacterized protein n=1 Tax=Lachnellula occidentalis TaxID=215460 RepID=A0A8H8RXR4_9HELO|nr:hypothetical protein LOCC1_G004462 [Lachnellula occidentalis]